MYSIYQTLKDSAAKHPHKTAVIDEFGKITYAELFQATEHLRTQLQKQGVTKGQAIGLITKDNRHFLISLYATVATGALAMPIFYLQKDNEITTAIKEAQLHAVLTDNTGQAELVGSEKKALENTDFFLAKTLRPPEKLTANFVENPAFMRFTSGTTGKAKGVIISHEAAFERIEAANAHLKITSNDTIFWVFPMAFHFVVSIVLYVKNAATIVCHSDFLAESMINEMEAHGVTFLYCSPIHIKLLIAHKNPRILPRLRCVISTTTGASAEDCKTFENIYKLPVHQAFGIIEVGLPLINFNEANQHPGAVGHPLPAYEVAILNEELQSVPNNELGQLAIRGAGMFSGYLSPPKPLDLVLQNGWFLTGDLATQSPSGLVTILGRQKNVIIVHGNKVFPGEIEDVINTFPGIKQSKAYGKKHALFGEVVEAQIVVEGEIDTKALLKFCRKSLSAFKVPQHFQVVDAIEMTASGKIKRA